MVVLLCTFKTLRALLLCCASIMIFYPQGTITENLPTCKLMEIFCYLQKLNTGNPSSLIIEIIGIISGHDLSVLSVDFIIAQL